MATAYSGPVTPAELGGRGARLKFTSSTRDNQKPRLLDVSVADRPEGNGAQATVYRVDPSQRWAAEDYNALGIAPGTPLVARFTTKESAASPRRKAALRSIIDRQGCEPDTMIGMVRIYGFGVVELINGKPVQDVTIYFDLMVFAGKPLDKCVGPGGKRWSLMAGESAAALVPAAKALAALHNIVQTDEGRMVATAHRDIKPENMLVVWPESKEYRLAVQQLSPEVVPGYGLPLVRIGDLGDVRSVGTEGGATGTGTMTNSGRWTPADGYNGSNVQIPSAADVWSFGATLFFAATGSYPWTGEDAVVAFEPFRFMTNTRERPDSPKFAELPGPLADLIRRCLAVEPAARPSMATVAVDLEALVATVGVFAGAETPTREIRVPIVAIPRHPKPVAPPTPVMGKEANPFLVLLGVIAAFVALALFAQYMASSRAPHTASTATTAAAAGQQSSAPSPEPSKAPPQSPRADELAKALASEQAKTEAMKNTVVGIGPWTGNELNAAMKEPLAPTGLAFKWANMALAPGRDTTNAGFKINTVPNAGMLLSRPSFVYELSEIRNSSTRPMTFALGNCDIADNNPSKTGPGPFLLVSGPGEDIYRGFRPYDKSLPMASTPACKNPLTIWQDPISVPAGMTWKSDQTVQLVFEMPASATVDAYKAVGFLLKSTAGDVAFASFSADSGTNLQIPKPLNCAC